jgi:hypothetical protein
MTASELITFLQMQPPDIKIVVRGYEEGYNDISQLIPVNISEGKNSKWYYGEYLKNNTNSSISAIELFVENKVQKETL